MIPALFGALCGWLLGVNEIAYLVFTVAAIAGGYFAGQEHDGWLEGALRGIVGGTLFGGFILIVHELLGDEPKAELPHPKSLLLVITVGFGVILGALGGRARHRAEEAGEADKPMFDFKRLHWAEFVGFGGSAVLIFSLFLPWFATSCETVRPRPMPAGCNPNSLLDGGADKVRGTFNAFETYPTLDGLLVAAAVAPFILAYIIVRGHALTWRPGEVTMIVGMVAFALILLNGIILGRPGTEPDNVDISIKYGYLVGLLGAALITVGGFIRQAMQIRSRKPPGVL